LRLNLSPTEIVPVIESAIDVVRPGAEAKGIKISTSYNSTIDTITCDPQRLQQMIWNLLTNAVKFTPQNGSVEIKLEQTEGKVQIVVTDSGQGISPDFLPFVFDRFRQADSSSTRTHGGLGLGLAIVRHLTELHGGSVKVTSEGRGKGAAFTITLPVSLVVAPPKESVRGDANGHHQKEDFNPELSGVRVLIVDDDADTCEMLRFVLNHWGAEAQASNSVAEAFDSIAEWQPDILLSDINMPGEDGYALISKLRASSPEQGANIPAIALTALARPEDSEQAISAGFQLHLTKPVDSQKLAEAIANLAGKFM
jgi:CheY-like chemotaxis protein/anti-sigma regulatory factor (Ser/Thr protein kinase)